MNTEPKQPNLSTLSGPKLKTRISVLDAEHSASTSRLIAAGLGSARGSDIETLAKGSSLLANVRLAREHMEICRRRNDAFCELAARERYHGSDKPIRTRNA
jgi:hypothetical protein